MNEKDSNNSNIRVDWEKTGEKIRKLMKKHMYTNSNLAGELNVSENCLKHYLYGTRKIPIEICKQSSLIFGYKSVEEILVYEDK